MDAVRGGAVALGAWKSLACQPVVGAQLGTAWPNDRTVTDEVIRESESIPNISEASKSDALILGTVG
jgi:hypothetical protein